MRELRRSLAAATMVVALVAVAGCVSTETVTFSDSAVAAATATAGTTGTTGTTEPSAADVDRDEPTAIPPLQTPADPAATSPPDAPTVTPTTAPPTTVTPTTEATCRFDFVDSFDDIQIELEFTSDLPTQSDVFVNYVLFDSSGAEIVSLSRTVEDLKPGEQVRRSIDTFTDAPTNPATHAGITCEVVNIEPSNFGPEPFRPQPGDSCRFVELDSVDDIQIEITVANPTTTAGQLSVDYALRGPDGVRFGEGTASTRAFDPGEQITVAIDTITKLPSWVDQDSFSCEILAIAEF